MNKPFAENDRALDRAIAAEVEALMNQWRSNALLVVFAVGSIAVLPSMVAVMSGRIFSLPWPLRVLCVLLYLAMVAACLLRRQPLRWRVAVILVVMGVFAAIQLLVTQLPGSGRLSLLTLPVIALLLVGPRTGWWMMGFSLMVFTGTAVLAQTGLMAQTMATPEGVAATPAFWWLQGLRLAVGLLLLQMLLTQFLSLQRRTMISERTALRKLEMETNERKRTEAEVSRVSEVERRNLGAELHDGLCQNLTAALLNCTALENRQKASESSDAAETAHIRQAIEESIDMAYDVARGLCPVDLDGEGLASALEGLCHAVQRRGIACELRTVGDVTVADLDCSLQLYRIASEALTNAVKHADAERIAVRLVRESGRLELSVTDDGKGISEDSGAGLGCRIMAYRASLIGGSLTVSGTPGLGTSVICQIPDTGGAT